MSQPETNSYGPITPSELLQRTFVMYWERPRLVFGLILIVAAVQMIATGVITSSIAFLHQRANMQATPLQWFVLICIFLLAMLLVYTVTQVVQGAFFYIVASKLQDRQLTVGEACGHALNRLGHLIGVSMQVALRVLGYAILIGLILDVIGIVVFFSLRSAMGGTLYTTGWEGYAVILVPLVVTLLAIYAAAIFWVIARYAISIPACLAENLPSSAAIRRSIMLSSNSRSRIYAMYAFVLMLMVASVVIALPLGLLAMHPGTHSSLFFFWNAAGSAVHLFFGAWMVSFSGIATTLCYYDLCSRKEAFCWVDTRRVQVVSGVQPIQPTDITEHPMDNPDWGSTDSAKETSLTSTQLPPDGMDGL